MKFLWRRVSPENPVGEIKIAISSSRARRLMLAGGIAGASFAVLACGQEPASDPERSLTTQVGSAPPTAGLGGGPRQSLAATRDRKAREAFDRWAPLLSSGATGQARVLCEAWLGEPDEGHHGEAHKCLANVEITTGGGAIGMRSRISRARSNAAVAHYDAALATVPNDPDAHLGRVDVLILAGRYREANIALDNSLEFFSSRALLDKWFRLLGRFQRAGEVEQGLAFLQTLEKHHPLDHRVVSNLGAFYAMTGDAEKAVEYSERAVAINPDDPINKWNLARIYDRQGRLEDANRHYLEALAVFGDDDPKARCDYAEFIGSRLGDLAKACSFAEENCKALFAENCGAEAGTEKNASGTKESPRAG